MAPEILIDDRGKLCKALASQMNLEPSRCEWDVMWESGAIELKTASDLAGSIKSGHMQDQEKRLLAMEIPAYLLVVGSFIPCYVGKKPATLASSIFEDEFSKSVVPRLYRGEISGVGKYRLFRSPHYTYSNYLLRLQEKGIGITYSHGLDGLGKIVEHLIRRNRKQNK